MNLPWWGWVIVVFLVLSAIGYIIETFEKMREKERAQEGKSNTPAERPVAFTFNRDAVPMHDGVPDVGESIRQAKVLFAAGREVEALNILHDCRSICAEMELASSVQALSNEIMGLRQQNDADEVADDVLAEIARHPDGIMQTALYKELPGIDTDLARFACYRLAEAGRITREKKGRSYILRLTGTQ